MDDAGPNGPRQQPRREQDQQPRREQDQRGKADELVGKRIGIRSKLGERAQRAQSPGDGEPAGEDAPAREQ